MEHYEYAAHMQPVETHQTHGVVMGGVLVTGIPDSFIFVNSKADRSMCEDMPAGTMVGTYDYKNIWVLKPGKEWSTLREEVANG